MENNFIILSVSYNLNINMKTKIQNLEDYFNNEIPTLINNCRKIVKENSDIKAIYLVGGTIRDILSNIKQSEPDIAISGDYKKFSILLSKIYNGKVKFHPQFLSAQIILSKPNFKEDFHIDVNSLRTEKYQSPGNFPEIKKTKDIKRDLMRRDFTVNSIALEISCNNELSLIDPFEGLKDIKHKIIKILHNKSFIDDPTRIFRAINYKFKNQFEIDKETIKLMQISIKDIKNINQYRIKKEIRIFFNSIVDIHKIEFAEKLHLFEEISKDLEIITINRLKLSPLNIPTYLPIKINFLEKFGMILFNYNQKEIENILNWVQLNKSEKNKLFEIPNMNLIFTKFSEKKITTTEIYENLNNIPIEIIKSYKYVCESNEFKKIIGNYLKNKSTHPL